MTLVCLMIPFLRQGISVGSVSFSYDDQANFSFVPDTQLLTENLDPHTGTRTKETVSIDPKMQAFQLRDDLVVEIKSGVFMNEVAIEQLKKGAKLTFRDKVKSTEGYPIIFLYIPSISPFGGASFIENDSKDMRLAWVFTIGKELVFFIDNRSWGVINLRSENVLISGSLGKTLKIPLVDPVPPKRLQFPNQSPPVNRRTIFDPNQHNADPAVALGSDPNDPMRFSEPINCGCYILSGISLTRCLAACRR